ncbi:MAG: four helix bundle protein [Clostridium cochlearium]|uniref:four helix bundle protein n=2 Tax=Clostridium cochlearium TaxID=1494 RepID=UPI00280B8164|nr:four helix bundle protein [Clostridium cochlearium]MDU1442527.1 four helix bundle protein [Clostridium cochlearium]
MKDDILSIKSKKFALKIIKLYKMLTKEKKEYIISKQLLKSATSIGANIREAQFAESKKDFISKMSIALKETGETLYWIELLTESDYITPFQSKDIIQDCLELLKILQATVKTSKKAN